MKIEYGDEYFATRRAFVKAWDGACRSSLNATVVVPGGKTYFLSPLIFKGPCEAPSIHVQVYGKGKLNGKGLPWWKYVKQAYKAEYINDVRNLNQRKDIDICSRRPAVLSFTNCNKLELKGLTFVNPPNNHISIRSCNNFRVSRLTISAPKDSPNTDGIDITNSTNINITSSKISTGLGFICFVALLLHFRLFLFCFTALRLIECQ
ncbi:probable polygalacturonase At3g15720 [Impatiens glandulifera]|uniref:probable polygalacturonase At3g15720 n=1 Tax=Impatiens glandulifera TaxID=253017 RepID=UPI001FB104B8|nr:probable polygalacturonase At3g15720 [Impatiens glandulifera]